RARRTVRLADSLATSGTIDRFDGPADGYVYKRAAPGGREVQGEGSRGCKIRLQDASVLPPDDRQYVFDRRRERHATESKVVSEPGSALRTGRGGADPVPGPGFQYCGAVTDGLAGRPLSQEKRHAAHLCAGRCGHSFPVVRSHATDAVCLRCDFWDCAGW